MADLPVMLNVRGRRCVVVGGGSVARRRVAALLDAGAEVTVIAPKIDRELETAGGRPITLLSRPFRAGDLVGALLVVIATNDSEVNNTVAAEARASGVLVNRADDPTAGDLVIPAHEQHGPITVAVHTGGISPSAAATIRRELSATLDRDWITLLETIAPYRSRLQQTCADANERQQRLAALGSPHAMETLKKGGPEALRQHCEAICQRESRDA